GLGSRLAAHAARAPARGARPAGLVVAPGGAQRGQPAADAAQERPRARPALLAGPLRHRRQLVVAAGRCVAARGVEARAVASEAGARAEALALAALDLPVGVARELGDLPLAGAGVALDGSVAAARRGARGRRDEH